MDLLSSFLAFLSKPLAWLHMSAWLGFVIMALAYHYFTSTFSYWDNRGVKYVKPYPVVGSMLPVMTLQKHMMNHFQDMYLQHEDEPFVGFFQGRSHALLIRDPELAKNILVKDFAHFVDHGFKVHEDADPLQAKHLFNMEGQRWREMRSKLSPTFTSGRMKAMFPLVLECSKQLESHLQKEIQQNQLIEMKDVLARYTTDTIASCAFGIVSNAISDPNCEFRTMGKKLLEMDIWRGFKTFVILFAPEISLRLRLAIMSRELTQYFRKMVKNVMELRAKTGVVRDDFMQLLIELKEKGCVSPEEDEDLTRVSKSTDPVEIPHPALTHMRLTDDEVTAQATVFFLAGFETSSSVMSFALLELAVHPDVQRRAQQEIDEVLQRHDNKITYNSVHDMKYLDWIMQESMRKYPPTVALIRICTKNYSIPNSHLTIEKGTHLVIPIHALQNDPKYFSHPDRFDPERFSKVDTFKYSKQYIHMPFGEGPRQCIGYRFAKMQTKLGLLAVLRRFEVLLAPGMTYPVIFDPKLPIPQPIGNFWLQLKPKQKVIK